MQSVSFSGDTSYPDTDLSQYHQALVDDQRRVYYATRSGCSLEWLGFPKGSCVFICDEAVTKVLLCIPRRPPT